MELGGKFRARAMGHPWVGCARTFRHWYGRLGRLEVAEGRVLRHPSKHTVDSEIWAAQVRTIRDSVTPVTPELGFEDLLETWGHPA